MSLLWRRPNSLPLTIQFDRVKFNGHRTHRAQPPTQARFFECFLGYCYTAEEQRHRSLIIIELLVNARSQVRSPLLSARQSPTAIVGVFIISSSVVKV